jgi:IS4 transposase
MRRVEHLGQSRLLREVESDLQSQLKYARRVEFKGKKAYQWVGETVVTLKGAARNQRKRNGKLINRNIKGRRLQLRLIIAEVRDKEGKQLATWRVWTNVEQSVSAETISLWYYWRWRIETFFKLLKRAGQHLEQWQQERAEAVAKRVAVAAQALIIRAVAKSVDKWN